MTMTRDPSSPTSLLSFSLVLLFLTSTLFCTTQGESILFFYQFNYRSHLTAAEPLIEALLDRGHHVTLLSSLQLSSTKYANHPNSTHFCPEAILRKIRESESPNPESGSDPKIEKNLAEDIGTKVVLDRLESKYNDIFLQTTATWDGSITVCRNYYAAPDFKAWLRGQLKSRSRSRSKGPWPFDLVVMDEIGRACAFPVAYLLSPKWIVFSPSALFTAEQETFGIPLESSHVIGFHTEWEWPWNVLVPDPLYLEYDRIKFHLWKTYQYVPKYEELARTELAEFKRSSRGQGQGQDFPKIDDLERQTALYFINTHYSSEFPRSLPPFFVNVGGMHCKATTGISDPKVRAFVEDKSRANRGFIFISFGSIYKMSALGPEKLKIFFDAIAAFPDIRFLWKWSKDEGPFPLEPLPKNLYIAPWFGQQELLGHGKCLGFVSQGGLMSFQQTIFHGVPCIIIPMGSGDQTYQARTMEKMGFGIYLEISEMTSTIFTSAVNEILVNPKYKNKVRELSTLARDRPMTAVETGVWWTEFVLRRSLTSLDQLKSPGIYQFWWERRLLHIWVPLTLLAVALVYLTSKALSYIFFSLLFSSSSTKLKTKTYDGNKSRGKSEVKKGGKSN